MINTYNKIIMQMFSTGGVAPSRHDLAKHAYIQKRKAQRAAAQQFRVTQMLAGVAKFLAGVTHLVKDVPVDQHANAKLETV